MEESKQEKLLEFFNDEKFNESANKCKNEKDFIALLLNYELEMTEEELKEFFNTQVKELDDKSNISAGKHHRFRSIFSKYYGIR